MKLSTKSNTRTREHTIPIAIKFMKPVLGFNSSYVSVSGGHLQRQVLHIISNLLYIYLYAFIFMHLSVQNTHAHTHNESIA